MSGKIGLRSEREVLDIIEGFWRMTDLAIQANKNRGGPQEIEFWMHKLFNKVGGYMAKNGFKEPWQNSLDKRLGYGVKKCFLVAVNFSMKNKSTSFLRTYKENERLYASRCSS